MFTSIRKFVSAYVILGAVVAIAGTASVAALSLQGSGDGPHSPETLPPPAYSLWISCEGKFDVFEYDDRHLSAAEKERNPLVNPRWEPFSECMSGRGQPLQVAGPDGIRQGDIDRLVARANQEHPDRRVNKLVSNAEDTPGLASDFLHCADEWLNLDTAELERRLAE